VCGCVWGGGGDPKKTAQEVRPKWGPWPPIPSKQINIKSSSGALQTWQAYNLRTGGWGVQGGGGGTQIRLTERSGPSGAPDGSVSASSAAPPLAPE